MGGSTGRLGLVDMVPLQLMSNWFALIRHGGVDVVGSLERFLIVFQA